MTRLKYIYLADTHFQGGKNHGTQLLAKPGIELYYNDDQKWFEVVFNKERAQIPMSIVRSWMNWSDAVSEPIVNATLPMDSKKIKSAQVSTPMGHVFEGEGAGKKNDRA